MYAKKIIPVYKFFDRLKTEYLCYSWTLADVRIFIDVDRIVSRDKHVC